MSHLLHPDYIRRIPLTGSILKRRLEEISEAAAEKKFVMPNISVAIRSFNEAAAIDTLLRDIIRQKIGAAKLDIVVVDNESSDGTVAVAKKYGARVVNLPRGEFTYPRSMNLAVQSAKNDLVFLTVGHATLSNDQLLRGGVMRLGDRDSGVAGIYADNLPSSRASLTERLIAINNRFLLCDYYAKRSGMGVFAATGIMLRKSVWIELGKFDERYENGGEDSAMAAKMLAAGYKIAHDPILSVHHSHGLSAMNTIRQWRYWLTLNQPQEFNVTKLRARRPDIRFDNNPPLSDDDKG